MMYEYSLLHFWLDVHFIDANKSTNCDRDSLVTKEPQTDTLIYSF